MNAAVRASRLRWGCLRTLSDLHSVPVVAVTESMTCARKCALAFCACVRACVRTLVRARVTLPHLGVHACLGTSEYAHA
eukprot:6208364-Pleurochrysis_carterae.AAC.3